MYGHLNLHDEVYIAQPPGYVLEGQKQLTFSQIAVTVPQIGTARAI